MKKHVSFRDSSASIKKLMCFYQEIDVKAIRTN